MPGRDVPVPSMYAVAAVPSIALIPAIWLASLLLLLVRDVRVPTLSAVAGVSSVALTPAAVSVTAAFACP